MNSFQFSKIYKSSIPLIIVVSLSYINIANASFYQPETLSNYCQEYIKYSQLDESAKSLEAGICSGYVASAIELMNLSDRLCKRKQLNVDRVIEQYIDGVEANVENNKHSAMYILVDILQSNYGCH